MTVSDSLTDSDSQESGAWLPLREAAAALGVGERTLHRRLRSGKLRKRSTLAGRVEIWIPGQSANRAKHSGPSTSDSGSDSVGLPDQERQLALLERFGETLQALIAPLQRELSEARVQVERLARENGELGADNRHLRERLAELEARLTVTVNESDSVGLSGGKATLPPAAAIRSWWRRWWPSRDQPDTDRQRD
jgi:hypothetical protein